MRGLIGVGVLVALVGVSAQEPAKAPTLTSEEAVMVQAVQAVQKSAQAACEALPAVKDYTALLTKANEALAKAGKAVDWRTGQAVAPAPAKK